MERPRSIAPGIARRIGLVAGLAIVLAARGAGIVSAQSPEPSPSSSPITWGVTPSSEDGPDGRASFTYSLDPGETVSDYVGVANYADEELTVSVYASDAFITEDGRFDLLAADQEPIDVGSWVEMEDEVTIPARSRADIPFRVSVPDNATPGDHVGGIVASVRFDDPGGQVAVDQRVGSRIYLRVNGELDPALEVRDLSVRYEASLNPLAGGRLLASYTVENVGNVRLSGVPRLSASGLFGLVDTGADGEPLAELLPGSVISATSELEAVWPLGPMTGVVEVSPVSVDPALAADLVPATASNRFWAVPLVHIALLAALALIGVRWLRRRFAESGPPPATDPDPRPAANQPGSKPAPDQPGAAVEPGADARQSAQKP